MIIIDIQKAIKMHVEKFGVEPKITGINLFDSHKVIQYILESIENNTPYVEQDVPDDVLI